MKIGMIGLGRMGGNMVLKLLEKKHKVVGYDHNKANIQRVVRKGAQGATSYQEVLQKLPKQKILWLMIPSKFVDNALKDLTPLLKRGDIVIDGGNSYFKDSIRRYNTLKKKGIKFIDVGTSGGIEGARHGACMMIGGNKADFKKTEALYRDMCVKDGYGYMGKAGAGHFVKMVHNGIEYGMMGAINEGFLAIEKHSRTFGTELKEVAKVYANGSIIESRLMSWLYESFQEHGYLQHISCEVPKGETEEEMKHLETLATMNVLHEARMMRARSRKQKICSRLIAAMRNKFGGHAVKKQ